MRVIVCDRTAPVGFVADRIERLVALPADRIEIDDAGAGEVDPAMVDGIIKGPECEGTVKLLNPERLLRDEYSRLGVSRERVRSDIATAAAAAGPTVASQRKVSLVSFELGAQEYALPLESVREIIRVPKQIAEMARSESAVLGVVTLRDRLLPLVSLHALLGLPTDVKREDRGKVVVLPMGAGAVGVVADRTREILHVDPADIDAAPSLLTRGEGVAEITSICRLDRGKRLVALLSPDRLFRSDLVRRILAEQNPGDAESQAEIASMAEEQFVIFRLGDQEYGLPVAAVDEIARPPEQIARLPKSPAFVEGAINLRGFVVPIVDLRRRFDISSSAAPGAQRILVLALNGAKTGFMVDSVSEVLKVPEGAIRPAPEVSSEQTRLIGRVATLDAKNRMILLVDPAQLLDRIEADVLAKFDRIALKRESKVL
jgi:purine-binding chemotaxis protein CheW